MTESFKLFLKRERKLIETLYNFAKLTLVKFCYSNGLMFKKIILLLVSLLCLQGEASTGYFLVASGGGNFQTLHPTFSNLSPLNGSLFKALDTEYTHHKYFQGSIGAMYRYSIIRLFNLSGFVYFTYDYKNLDLKKSIDSAISTKVKKDPVKIESDVVLKNKFGVGFDVQAGIPFSALVVYASCGIKLNFPKIQGSIHSNHELTSKDESFAIYFGKEPQEINGVSFPKQTQNLNYLWRYNIGGGVQYFFLNRIFVGVNIKYFFPKTKKIHAKYSIYDPKGLIDSSPNPQPTSPKTKLNIETHFKEWGIFATFGIKI